jgi:glycosyltransferase involved in cell wall biosynthesis
VHERRALVAPAWYARGMGTPVISFEEALSARPPLMVALSRRFSPLQGVALALTNQRGVIAVIKGAPGSLAALVACAAVGRPKRVVVLEFIHRPESRTRVHGLLRDVARRLVEAPSIRRAMAVGHTLTAAEGELYAATYGVDPERFVQVRWPFCRTGEGATGQIRPGGRKVLSSGRAGSDWETLFRAAEGSDWELTAICSRLDEPKVRSLSNGRARVFAELDRGAHDQILRESDVYVMPMRERGVSAGHVRLMAAVDAGIPTVASGIEALKEYLVPGETAITVEPGVPAELRGAVDALLDDPERRRALRDAALTRARGWTYEHYFERMRGLMEAAASS